MICIDVGECCCYCTREKIDIRPFGHDRHIVDRRCPRYHSRMASQLIGRGRSKAHRSALSIVAVRRFIDQVSGYVADK